MRMRAAVGALIALAMSTERLSAASEATLQPGAYEVQVRLVLPNLDDNTAVKIVEICISDGGLHKNPGLAVLSDNNPLGKCPISEMRTMGNELTFDIQCPGGNAARASARFILGGASFKGRIEMNMGGKNMTMTEVQVGKRIRNCDANDGP